MRLWASNYSDRKSASTTTTDPWTTTTTTTRQPPRNSAYPTRTSIPFFMPLYLFILCWLMMAGLLYTLTVYGVWGLLSAHSSFWLLWFWDSKSCLTCSCQSCCASLTNMGKLRMSKGRKLRKRIGGSVVTRRGRKKVKPARIEVCIYSRRITRSEN